MTTKTTSLIRQAYLKPELRAPILASLGYRTVVSADEGDVDDLLRDVVRIISDKFDGKMRGISSVSHGTFTEEYLRQPYAETYFVVTDDDIEHGFEITIRYVGDDRYGFYMYPKNNFRPENVVLNGARRSEVLDVVREKVQEWYTQGSARDLIRAAASIISREIDGDLTFAKTTMRGITQALATFRISGLSKVWFHLEASTSVGGDRVLQVQQSGRNNLRNIVKSIKLMGSSDKILADLRPMVTGWKDRLSKVQVLEVMAPKIQQEIQQVAENIKGDLEVMLTPKGVQPPVRAEMKVVEYDIGEFSVDDQGRVNMYFMLGVERLPIGVSIKKLDNLLKRALAKPRPGYICYYIGHGRREFQVQSQQPLW